MSFPHPLSLSTFERFCARQTARIHREADRRLARVREARLQSAQEGWITRGRVSGYLGTTRLPEDGDWPGETEP